jgi:hypothetical protein
VVALVLGTAVLDEHVTPVMLAGIPLVLAGCWLATSSAKPTATSAASASESDALDTDLPPPPPDPAAIAVT